MKRPLTTVVICSRDGAAVLPETLDALANQRVDFAFDVVVVDDGSRDDTAELARASTAAMPEHIRGRVVLHETSEGVGASRADGLRGVRTPVVVMIDDDCVAPPHWLATLMAAWRQADPGIMAIGGFVRAHRRDTFNRRYLDAREPHRPLELDFARRAGLMGRLLRAARPPHHAGRRAVYSLVGGNLSFRRSALEAVGGYDRAIRFGGPETRVCEALRERYGDDSLLALPELVVSHEFEPELASTMGRAWRAGRAAGRDWAWRGGLPSLRPAPAVVGAAALVASVATMALGGRPMGLLAGLASVLTAGTWAWGRTLRSESPESLAYPVVAAVEEIVHDVGVIAGYISHHGERAPAGR